jgi:hypothetical protein
LAAASRPDAASAAAFLPICTMTWLALTSMPTAESVGWPLVSASRIDSSSAVLCSTTRAVAPADRTVAAAASSTTLTTTVSFAWSSQMPAHPVTNSDPSRSGVPRT